MAEIVESPPFDFRPLEEAVELVRVGAPVEGQATRRAQHEIVRSLPSSASRGPFAVLVVPMLSEHGTRERRYRDRSAVALGLRLDKLHNAVQSLQGTPDHDRSRGEVNVPPPERKELALADARRQRQHVERPQSLPLQCAEELAYLLRAERLDLVPADSGRIDQRGDVATRPAPAHGPSQRTPQHGGDVLHAARDNPESSFSACLDDSLWPAER